MPGKAAGTAFLKEAGHRGVHPARSVVSINEASLVAEKAD